MTINNKIKTILFVLILITSQLYGQNFYEDGSMILTNVSSDKNYGYKPENKTSIKVGKIENQQAFLKALRGPNSETVQYRRLGSCCSFKSKSTAFGKGFLDKYEVYYQGLREPIILYLNGYDYESPKCPMGFTYVTVENIEKPIIFPIDSIKKVDFCNDKNIFSVKEFLLKEKVGTFPEPDTNPNFEGGIEELKKYFVESALTDNRLKGVVFRVAIGFIVDCNGKAGNFVVITKGKGLAETFANQVLEKVNNMPQNWKPAIKDENQVDAFQVLSFTVISGQLDKVTYR